MTTNTASSALTEEHLAKVSAAVTDVVGEEGLSSLIVANIRDCFRLDAIGRIRSATSFESALNEMRQNLKDASTCLVGLKVFVSMIPKGCEGRLEEALDDRVAFSVTRVVLSCLLRHLANKPIQKWGLNLLLTIVSLHSCDVVIRLLSSRRGITTIVAVLRHYPVNAMIQRTAWSTLVAVKNQAHSHLVEFCSFAAKAETIISTIFDALENHSAHSCIVTSAFEILFTIGLRAIQPGRPRQAFYKYFDAHPEWSDIVMDASVTQDIYLQTVLFAPIMQFFVRAANGMRN